MSVAPLPILRVAAGVLCVALAACATPRGRGERREVVIWFADHREVMEGTIDTDPLLHMGWVDVNAQVSGMRCVGVAQLVRIPKGTPYPRECEGVQGIAPLSCSDGRQMSAVWESEGRCGTGYGEGQDQHGNAFHLAYGISEGTASAMVRDALASVERYPPLPSHEDALAARARGMRTGTAFFVSSEGHLVTSHHVVEGAARVQVVLDGEEVLDVSVIDTDPDNDLALLQVDAIRRPLPVMRAMDVAKGEEVFTLGYPLVSLQGREQKATFGRVNALTGAAGDERFAQIDVPIQPGNSGGPLLNRRGEVVGVVTAMLNQRETFELAGVVPQNVNYALKASILHDMLRPRLGRDWSRARASSEPRSFESLIAELQESVVIVLAE